MERQREEVLFTSRLEKHLRNTIHLFAQNEDITIKEWLHNFFEKFIKEYSKVNTGKSANIYKDACENFKIYLESKK